MKVALLGHHGKQSGIEDALRRADFEFCDPFTFRYDLVLADTDHPGSPPPEKHMVLKECAKRGIPIVLYPHGAPPDLDYDGLRKIELPISMRLVHGEGHAEIARRYGCKHRVEVVGWSFCETVAPQAETGSGTTAVSHLLFAPIHPWANGVDILDFHRGLNRAAYHAFLDHPAQVKTVRMYGADDPNGITERCADVQYTQTDLGSGLNVIDAQDAVLSYGTFAYVSLARGKPTAFIYAYPGHTDDLGQVHARTYNAYRDYCAYPASIGNGSLDELFSRDVTDWKRLFLGEPLDEEHLVSLLREYRANRAQRRKLARAR